MSVPSEDEKILIQTFRTKVQDILVTEEHKSDHFLIRWIRARDGNLPRAEAMIRNSFQWRNENKLDTILQTKMDPFMQNLYPYSVKGRDREGRVVLEVPIGQWDIRKAMDSGKEQEFLNYINYYFEDIMREIAKANKEREGEEGYFPITGFVCLADWSGYSYGQVVHVKAVSGLLKAAQQYESHYPEILHSAYMINCPVFFSILFGLLKTVFAPKTLGKIQLFGSNTEEWVPSIDKAVTEEQRSTRFGGSMKQTLEMIM